MTHQEPQETGLTSKDGSPWLTGLRRALPIILGYLPVGFAFGVLAVKNGISPGFALAMSALMYSGSGQFVFASLWGAGVGPLSVAAAVGIVNLRYMLMSAAEAPWMEGIGRWRRFFLGWGVTDETFVVNVTALQEGWKLNTTALFACNQGAQLGWMGGTAIGAFCGALVEDVRPLGLDYAITAMFIALLVPQCSSKRHLVVAIFTLCLSIALKAAGMSQWNVAVATMAGATLGLVMTLKAEDAV